MDVLCRPEKSWLNLGELGLELLHLLLISNDTLVEVCPLLSVISLLTVFYRIAKIDIVELFPRLYLLSMLSSTALSCRSVIAGVISLNHC